MIQHIPFPIAIGHCELVKVNQERRRNSPFLRHINALRDELSAASAPSQIMVTSPLFENRNVTLLPAFSPLDELSRAAFQIADLAANFFACWIQKHVGRESLDSIFLLELLVLFGFSWG